MEMCMKYYKNTLYTNFLSSRQQTGKSVQRKVLRLLRSLGVIAIFFTKRDYRSAVDNHESAEYNNGSTEDNQWATKDNHWSQEDNHESAEDKHQSTKDNH